MRKKVVAVLLALLLAGWGVLLFLQKRAPYQAPATLAPTAQPSASGSASASASPSGSSSAAPFASGSPTGNASADASGSASAGPDAAPPKLFNRPLRVIAYGWDLAAAGILANGGTTKSATSEFAKAGLDVEINVALSGATLEAALARGGEDKDGADIAILPLQSFVASYERLRALSLDMFFVTSWSRGREAIAATKAEWPSKTDVKLAGSGGDPATFLALWAFDIVGSPPNKVSLVSPSANATDAPFAAVDRGASVPLEPSRSTLLLTTADAPRLVPHIAVATRGLLENNSRALTAWASVWLGGARKLAQDAPSGARLIAGVKGAPEPIALLHQLGQATPATLADNVRAFGLSGRSAITVTALFQRAWSIWRNASVLATPSPDAAPISTGVVSSLARAEPAQAAAPTDETKPREIDASAKILLTYKQPDGKFDEATLIANLGFFSGIFERAPIRVSVGAGGAVDKSRTKKIIDDALGRFGLAQGRISAATKGVPQTAAAIEVLNVP